MLEIGNSRFFPSKEAGEHLSKLVLDLVVPDKYDKQVFSGIVRSICSQVNSLSEGSIQARYQASTSNPTVNAAVSYAQGDIVWNSQPSELSSVAPGVAAKYCLAGWLCTSPGIGPAATFTEIRWLTGK